MELVSFGTISAAADSHVMVIPLKPNPAPVRAQLVGVKGHFVGVHRNDMVLLFRDDDGTFYALPVDIGQHGMPGETSLTDITKTARLTLKPGTATFEVGGNHKLLFNGLKGKAMFYMPIYQLTWADGFMRFTDDGVQLGIAEKPNSDDTQHNITLTFSKNPNITLTLGSNITVNITNDKINIALKDTQLTIEDEQITVQTNDNNILRWQDGQWILTTDNITLKANEVKIGDDLLQPNDGVLTAKTLPVCPFTGVPMIQTASKHVLARG